MAIKAAFRCLVICVIYVFLNTFLTLNSAEAVVIIRDDFENNSSHLYEIPEDEKEGLRSLETIGPQAAELDPSDTLGEQRTVILLLHFPDIPPASFNEEDIKKFFFTGLPFVQSVDHFIREWSGEKTHLTGEVFPWMMMPKQSSDYSFSDPVPDILLLLKDAIESSKGLADFSKVDRLFLIFAGDSTIGFGTIGKGSFTEGSRFSVSWFGDRGFVFSLKYKLNSGVRVLLHELGHNFGLLHPGGWQVPSDDVCMHCDVNQVPTPGSGECQVSEYIDYFDIMGVGFRLSSRNRSRLFWLEEEELERVNTGGRYELDPADLPSLAKKGLIIPLGLNNKGEEIFYYLEYLPSINSVILRFLPGHVIGVIVDSLSHFLGEMFISNTLLKEGDLFCDPEKGVEIEFLGLSPDGNRALLEITVPPQQPTPTPTLTPTPTQTPNLPVVPRLVISGIDGEPVVQAVYNRKSRLVGFVIKAEVTVEEGGSIELVQKVRRARVTAIIQKSNGEEIVRKRRTSKKGIKIHYRFKKKDPSGIWSIVLLAEHPDHLASLPLEEEILSER